MAKQLPEDQVDRLAAQLLVVHHPGFHGSKTIHYACGAPKKLLDNVSKEL
jgi:hypothetical protein